MVGEVTEAVSLKKGLCRSVISVRYIHRDGKWSPLCGKSLLYLKPGKGMPGIQYGEYLLFHASFQMVPDNSNPNAFNYAKYLRNKGIKYTVWVEPGDWKKLSIGTTNPLRKISFQIRDRLLDRIRGSDLGNNEFAVAAALLLGYVDELGSELREAYSATGVTHILSVSGMHVGIIFLFLEFLLTFLNRNRIGNLVKIMLMLVFIWFYAFLTGLSPAVLRAAAMLSFIIVCRSLKRSPELINILAASLICLLVYNPLLLRDIGFQLSYLAVTGIILVYKPLCSLVRSEIWIVQKLWPIMAVTLSAQFATTPVSLYYFHQFPNYFLLTNLLVVPFSSLIIYAGIAVVVLSFVPYIAVISAKILSILVWMLNFFIQTMEKLPAATTRGIYISWIEMALLYLVLISGLVFLLRKKNIWLFIFLAGTIMLQGSSLSDKIRRYGYRGMTIYNFKNMMAVEFSSQDKVYLFYDPKSLNNIQGQLARNLTETANSWDERGAGRKFVIWLRGSSEKFSCLSIGKLLCWKGMFIQFSGIRVGILKEKIPKGLMKTIPLDYLVLSQNARVSVEEVLRVFNPRMLIIDGTSSRTTTERWCVDAAKLGIPCFPVSRKGALQEEF